MNAHNRGGSKSAVYILDHRLPNSCTVIQYLWTERSISPLLCSAVSRNDTEADMTLLCRYYTSTRMCFILYTSTPHLGLRFLL